jgi:hypothetical protein
MTRCIPRPLLRAGLLVASLASVALAGDPPPAPAAPAAKAAPEKAGPEIRWARSWTEAVEEAAERNVAIFLHSHGST